MGTEKPSFVQTEERIPVNPDFSVSPKILEYFGKTLREQNAGKGRNAYQSIVRNAEGKPEFLKITFSGFFLDREKANIIAEVKTLMV